MFLVNCSVVFLNLWYLFSKMRKKKLIFSPTKKKDSSGKQHGSIAQRKKQSQQRWCEKNHDTILLKKKFKRSNDKQFKLLQYNKSLVIQLNNVEEKNQEGILINKNLEEKTNNLVEENKYLQHEKLSLEDQMYDMIENNEQNNQNDDNNKGCIIDEFFKIVNDKLVESLSSFLNSRNKFHIWTKLLIINLRKYCTGEKITKMIEDVIELLQNII